MQAKEIKKLILKNIFNCIEHSPYSYVKSRSTVRKFITFVEAAILLRCALS